MGDEVITESDIWADIDAAFPPTPEREPGDIDVRQWMEHKSVSESAAIRQMKKLVAKGGWQWLMVLDANSGIGRRRVIRRVK